MSRFSWNLPYPSQREPVLARNVVATSQPLAAQAGLQMLRMGGNAVDAAVATAIAITVLEPTTNGIGSDAFAIVHVDGKLHGLNASGRAPRALAPSLFEGQKQMPTTGWGPITVPGAVSGWMELSKKFGKLPFAKLFEPAIEYATNGFPVAPQTARLWARAARRAREFAEFGRVFFPNGEAPEPGDIFRMPDHAKTLKLIADSKGEAFYMGEIARKIEAAAKADAGGGGVMAFNDLAAHAADWVEPISIDYHGYRLHEIPPNGQGLAALMMLGILRHRDISQLQVDCPDVLHLQIEAMKLAFADAHRYIADPRFMNVKVEQLLDDAYLAQRAKLIDPAQAQDFKHGEPKPGGTILLCAADASGGMVSLIQSNYQGFGSGVVIPGTGIAMQNRGACFTLEKGHPNEVGGGKRPYHTIIPGFVTQQRSEVRDQRSDVRDQRSEVGGQKSEADLRPLTSDLSALMAFGVMGGFMQPQAHAQVLIRMADFEQNPQAALDAPRWQVTGGGGLKVSMEPGFEPAVYEELRRRGHEIDIAERKSISFGGGQAILKLDSGAYLGASDLRRDGHAVGF